MVSGQIGIRRFRFPFLDRRRFNEPGLQIHVFPVLSLPQSIGPNPQLIPSRTAAVIVTLACFKSCLISAAEYCRSPFCSVWTSIFSKLGLSNSVPHSRFSDFSRSPFLSAQLKTERAYAIRPSSVLSLTPLPSLTRNRAKSSGCSLSTAVLLSKNGSTGQQVVFVLEPFVECLAFVFAKIVAFAVNISVPMARGFV